MKFFEPVVFRHSNNPFDGSILNSNASRNEVPLMVNTFKCHSTLLYTISTLYKYDIYMIVGLLFIGVYVGFCPINKWYITVVTWALMVCLIYTPSALGPAALVLWVYISGKPLELMLQLYNNI